MLTGPLFDPLNDQESASAFVLTPSVQRNVAMLARAVMARNYPILLEGPTSAGKTSVMNIWPNGRTSFRPDQQSRTHRHSRVLGHIRFRSGQRETRLQGGNPRSGPQKGTLVVLDELNLAPQTFSKHSIVFSMIIVNCFYLKPVKLSVLIPISNFSLHKTRLGQFTAVVRHFPGLSVPFP